MATDRLEPAFAPAFHAYRGQPTPTNASKFLNSVKPVIDEGVRLYGGGYTSPTLTAHARRLALETLPQYDPQRGSLKTHMMSQFRRLQRLGPRASQAISIPEGVAIDRLHLRETERTLQDELGRDPSDREVADATGLSFARLQSLRKFRPAMSEGEWNSGRLSGDGEDENTDPAVAQARPIHALAEFLYDDLDPTDQLILEHLTGLRGAEILPGREIARRANLSPGAISQRAQRIQAQLDRLADAELI